MPLNGNPLQYKDVQSILPHRFPCLLVDRILPAGTCIAEGRLSAIKNITANEPTFWTGHHQMTVFPGVLMVEALAQTTGLLAHYFLSPLLPGEHYYFAAIHRARFYRSARPGDQLCMEVTFVRQRSGIARFSGRASVNGRRICTAEFMCARK
ncbi:(3R)-hydroxymyristoyl-[acyl-carrier-protein] dehydratase [Serratia liquefaciens]|uniref:3-hydroxyacyl-ACP dehydratase FabZ n=1 Tax=Serratia liquefaciens TaxID=614 RepID=UPI002179953A|nr:3-hydroxyacyl-ACP dehydratase FabZ [Serratia liquefaciens]CAI0877228.1 (3R)-hydroxymyristoyl-[acyl-carrier-protein] dehydratase [Serratia liquefaciens]CAI1816398.1 (3R)-hydroxymyristoyl-[acyl-carrier-protein] dehydratase [Serratia liquefaciens]